MNMLLCVIVLLMNKCFFFFSCVFILITDTLGKYKTNTDDCKCQCLPHLESFREDLNICVDDIHGKSAQLVFNYNV